MGSVLVVDDEEMNRDLCARRLRRGGFTVAVAEDGPRALRMLELDHFDIVLLDQMMPQMSGVDVLRTLRLKHSPQELPVIMVTAVTEGARIAEALDLGANDYVTKPVDFTVAMARIRSQLARTETGNALRRSEERYALAAKGANEGLWDWDLERDEIYYSPRWKALLGYDQEELGSDPQVLFSRVHAADRKALEDAIHVQAHLAHGNKAAECNCRMQHRDGSYRWTMLRAVAVRSSDGRALRIVGSQSDVTEAATIDALTRLPNRNLFSDRLSTAFDRARNAASGHLAVLILDLDRFKLVNDSLSHASGDKLLIEVSERLRSAILADADLSRAESDFLVARLSGDEFAVLLENFADESAAERVASRIMKAMRPAFTLNGDEIYGTLSIGIATLQPSHTLGEELLRDADTAMYAAKAEGRGRWAIYAPAMKAMQQSRLQMDGDLRRAMERSEFEVYYQPRVQLDNGSICGFEALARWNHPTRGVVLPSEFIPAAEENGMIHEIGMWVLREACRQIHTWNLQFPRETPLDVAVNLSARQCHEPQLVQQVQEILKQTSLPASSLNLELTESLLLVNMQEARTVLNDLRSLGVGLKIDDFGTGYSCLKYLSELPFDTLKIDRSFIVDLHGSNNDAIEIVRTILRMAEGLKMGVIAEGIERMEHIERLQAMGCKFGQGFYFSKAVTARETEAMLARSSQPWEPALSAPSRASELRASR